MQDLFADAIGRSLATLDGLHAAHFPPNLDNEFLKKVVQAANSQRPESPPFAFRVAKDGFDSSDDSCRVTDVDGANSYRSNNRLAVADVQTSQNDSFTTTYQPALDLNFPEEGSEYKITLLGVTHYIATQIAAHFAPTINSHEIDRLSNTLSQCLKISAAALLGTSKDSEDLWNTIWYKHSSRSIANCARFSLHLAEMNPGQNVDILSSEYIFACFGLPQPSNGNEFSKGRMANLSASFDEAIQNYWFDEQQISSSIEAIRSLIPFGQVAPLAQIDWSGFDMKRIFDRNPFLAWLNQALPEASELNTESWFNSFESILSLTEEQYFEPFGKQDAPIEFLRLTNEFDVSLEISGTNRLQNLSALFAESIDGSSKCTTNKIRAYLGAAGNFTQDDLRNSQIYMSTSDSKIKFAGELGVSEELGLYFEGYLSLEIAKGTKHKYWQPLKLSLSIPEGDSLEKHLAPKGAVEIVLVPAWNPSVLAFKASSADKVSSGKVYGAAYPSSEIELHVDCSYPQGSSSVFIVSYGPSVSISGRELSSHKSDANLKTVTVPAHSTIDVLNGNTVFAFEPETLDFDIQSPIIAAINKLPLTAKPATDEAIQSIRGQIESLFARSLGQYPKTLHHLILENDLASRFGLPEDDLIEGLLIDPEVFSRLSKVSDFAVPEELLESHDYQQFLSASAKLDLYSKMVNRSPADSAEPDLPSRTSWRTLWENQKPDLELYLSSYSNLVAKAREIGNPYGVFWASYPFSSSIWDSTSGECVAVLISPLHPVRLTWLAAVESSLEKSTVSTLLAGTVEGWNLPFLGPDISDYGRMIALPSDNGPGQIFIGWSMLVQASVTSAQSLKPPTYIAGKIAPGAAAGGMNSSAAYASLRNYRRINPHLQSITIDLASVSQAQRLVEIDQTILEVTKNWALDAQDKLPGGILVMDSVNRLGNPPLSSITTIAVESGHNFPIVWRRYLPNANPASNIRLLQDSGLKVAVKPHGNNALGVIGTVPLRRFDCTTTQIHNNESVSSPTLAPEIGWYPLSKAIASLELPDDRPEIAAKLFNAQLINSNADWTISGETLVSPTGIADLLAPHNKTEQMLWEWRPPIFDAADFNSVLEKRPFISIARIPNSFKNQLVNLLGKARNRDLEIVDADPLLRELGSRGVGLSSLLSMGSTHAVGALGFYLTFKLMDMLPESEANVFVLPVDACNSFLGALVNEPETDISKKRADMLVVTITDDRLILSPIEIKVHGLASTSPHGPLPDSGSPLLNEAISQIKNTTALINKIRDSATALESGDNDSNRAVWFNALATLVESASRLAKNPAHDVERFRNRLNRILAGKLAVESGTGIICYFAHEAETALGDLVAHHTVDKGVAVFACNLEAAFEAVDGSQVGLPVREKWFESALAGLPSLVISTGETSEPTDSTNGTQKSQDPSDSVDQPEDQPTEQPADQPTPGETNRHSYDAPEPTGSKSDVDVQLDYPITDGIRFNVGTRPGLQGPANIDLWLSNTQLTHMNMGVVGNMGTGKTQLLKSLVYKIHTTAKKTQENPLSFLIFDYKEDYQAGDFVSKVNGKVLPPSQIPVNFFELSEPYSALAAFQKAQSFTSTLKKIYNGIGPVQENNLTQAIVDLFERPGNFAPTIREIRDAYKDIATSVDAVVSILNKFVLPQIFSEDKDNLLSFDSLIEGKTIIVALNKLGVDTETKNALVVLFLDMYYQHMLNSKKWPYSNGNPSLRKLNSFLLVDEATNIMAHEFVVLKSLLLQGREYGFGVILSSQYLSHFKTTNTKYTEALLTWFINNIPAVTKNELNAAGIQNATDDMAYKITTQEIHSGLYVSHGHDSVFIKELPFYKLFD